MSDRIWQSFLTPQDKAVFDAAGFGARMGFPERPAVLVVDVNYAFCGDRREPILEAIKRWPHACGEDAWDALPHIQAVIEAGRRRGLPIIYTTGIRRPDGWDSGGWAWKNTRQNEGIKPQGDKGQAIVEEIAPQPRDIVVRKQKPSGFHDTPLMSYLTLLDCDGIILMGTTTSGCVRATAVDAFSRNLRVTIVEEGCFDRSQSSHAISLCDLHAKYADVVGVAETLDHIAGLKEGLFTLPAGTGNAP